MPIKKMSVGRGSIGWPTFDPRNSKLLQQPYAKCWTVEQNIKPNSMHSIFFSLRHTFIHHFILFVFGLMRSKGVSYGQGIDCVFGHHFPRPWAAKKDKARRQGFHRLPNPIQTYCITYCDAVWLKQFICWLGKNKFYKMQIGNVSEAVLKTSRQIQVFEIFFLPSI